MTVRPSSVGLKFLGRYCELTQPFLTHALDKMFHFTCFNTDDPHDPSVGLVHGDLAIPGVLLRREVFDPVVHEV
jgi:hypothetical protein